MVLKVTLKVPQDSPESISQNSSQKGTELVLKPYTARKGYWLKNLAWLLSGVSPKPKSHARERDVGEAAQGEGQQCCSPSQVEA